MKRPKFTRPVIASLAIFFLGAFAIYNLPPVQERVGWRVAELMARVKYSISPPEESIFIPQEASILPAKTAPPTSSAPPAGNKITVTPPAAPSVLSTPTKTPTKIPQSINLAGFRHEYQTWNNCGPATLSMALSYWGWEGDQRPIAAFTKPNSRDKNVMPYEMTAYVEEETDLEIVYRVGGDVDLLKRFLASKLPVIIEKDSRDPTSMDGWVITCL